MMATQPAAAVMEDNLDPDATIAMRYWFAKGYYDAAHTAWRSSPSDHARRHRLDALMQLAAAREALIRTPKP
jgi:hypothetical protein